MQFHTCNLECIFAHKIFATSNKLRKHFRSTFSWSFQSQQLGKNNFLLVLWKNSDLKALWTLWIQGKHDAITLHCAQTSPWWFTLFMQTRCCKCCLLQSLFERRLQLCLKPCRLFLLDFICKEILRGCLTFEWGHIPTVTCRSPVEGTGNVCGQRILTTLK